METRSITLKQLFEDPKFNKALQGKVDAYRLSRRLLVGGLRCTPFDNLNYNGEFTVRFLKAEFLLILAKQSVKSSTTRSAIATLVAAVINRFIAESEKQI